MPAINSLRARVLLWVSLALVLVFGVTVIGLNVIFERSVDTELRDALQAQLLGLIAAAEESDDEELSLPDDALPDLSLTVPGSGVYGVIWDADGVPIWRSASWVGREWLVNRWPVPGERIYLTIEEPDLPNLDGLLMGIRWDFTDGSSLPYTFGVALAEAQYVARKAAFRRNLIGWFLALTITMVVVLMIALRYAMKPLRRLVTEVGEIETGRRQAMTERLPSELVGLARNLNYLIDAERRRSIRYRNTLDDLAHSLKTPLASLRALLADRNIDVDGLAEAVDREVSRMDQRIGYQLRRARATGGTGLGLPPVPLASIVDDIVGTLDKVYRDKQVSCELEIDANARYQGDPGDLNEMLGNLIDNAYKYCRKRVLVVARSSVERVEIEVHDDGPGLPVEAEEAILERGARADESTPGQGIGLAVVAETVELYQGSLSFGTSELGGTAVRITLPRRGYRLKKEN